MGDLDQARGLTVCLPSFSPVNVTEKILPSQLAEFEVGKKDLTQSCQVAEVTLHNTGATGVPPSYGK